MKFKIIDNKKTWEDFVGDFHPNNFLTSWAWGEFNKLTGDDIYRLGLYEAEKLVGVCLAIKVTAKRGNFLLCPAGPLLKDFKKNRLDFFISELRDLAKRQNLKFIRLRPLVTPEIGKDLLEEFVKSPTHVHAQVSWLLNLSPSEEELLAAMRKTTRYLIKQAAKQDVTVEEKTNFESLKVFENLQDETVKAHHFVPFSNQYLENEFKVFSADNEFKIFLAKKGREVLSAALVVFYGDSAFYHHGASFRSKIPSSYLLQWEAILTAKRLGKKYYNFWGIAPNESEKHPWHGLTVFKQGFGGYKLEYVWPSDVPLSAFYPLIHLFEKLRNYNRGLANG
ncbi:MAG TPA: peptidoglycan bridge formation glycyltransferase FemA/FemB family protein [Candidatus Nanoarchaeia archaeon]|nr:hypothetical protein [uncultured archaeon]